MGSLPKMQLDVVVVGGSTAGLCVGVALKDLPQVGSITILERYAEDRMQDQGAGIRSADETLQFMRRYAHAAPEDFGVAMTRYVGLDGTGSITVDRPMPGSYSTTWIRFFLTLLSAFRTTDQKQGAKCQYRYSCTLKDITREDQDGRVRIVFSNEHDEQEALKADLVIGADGASSKVREILLPEVKRKYVGYVLLRGLVPMSHLSAETQEATQHAFTCAYTQNSQVLSYAVPAGIKGPPEAEINLNWAWYIELNEAELADVMTDAKGRKYQYALPQGAMKEGHAAKFQAMAKKMLGPQFCEAVEKTKSPFIQVITDAETRQNTFWEGKVLLVGDAAGGQRPHTGSAVTAACYHAHLLRLQLMGEMSVEQWSANAQVVSQTIFKCGQAIGAVILAELDPGEKARQVAPLLFQCIQVLGDKWKEHEI
jgi:2-polyprenyl-6-methoxyphenol hydroxylase-like FAD-dependent oxidoreductase